MSETPLQQIRNQIDAIDQQIVALLNQRAYLALRTREHKDPAEIHSALREQQVLQNIQNMAPSLLSPTHRQNIYKHIISACRHLQLHSSL